MVVTGSKILNYACHEGIRQGGEEEVQQRHMRQTCVTTVQRWSAIHGRWVELTSLSVKWADKLW